MSPTVALPGSMTWMGIRLSSGSRCPQSPKGLSLHLFNHSFTTAVRPKTTPRRVAHSNVIRHSRSKTPLYLAKRGRDRIGAALTVPEREEKRTRKAGPPGLEEFTDMYSFHVLAAR